MRVGLTTHAKTRIRERGIDVHEAAVAIEVAEAFAAHRTAKHAPVWGVNGRYRMEARRNHGKVRFVWPEHERYFYIVREKGDRWIVLTVIPRGQ